MGGDVTVVRDDGKAYDDGTVARVRILSVPKSEQYPKGIKYAFHYGEAGVENPIIRFDNHHGPHELHLSSETYEITFPGVEALYEAWQAALPEDKRAAAVTVASQENSTMTRTLHVYIGSGPDRSDLKDTLAALDDGEDFDSKPSTLVVESLETFGRIFRPTNLELLEAIAEHDPDSIRELARVVDRHPPEVTENVSELENYGIIELRDSGRAKKPRLWYDEIEISGDVPLRGLSDGGGVTAIL